MKINWPTGFTILAVLCVTLVGNNFASAQSTGSGINWGELCRNPAVDPMIAEPCESLTSPDGYQLTPEGNRVLYCILAGGVGKLVGVSDNDLKQLAPVAGCGPQPSSNILPSPRNPEIDQSTSSSLEPSTTSIVPSPSASQFSAELSGSNEVPPVDSDASGTAFFSLDNGIISYRIEVTGMDEEPVTEAHLHSGREGSNGEVVVILVTDNPAEGSINSSDLEGPLEGKTIDNLVDLMKKGSIYVNLHSNIFPDGEIRGTVKSDNFAATTLQKSAQSEILDKSTKTLSVNVYNAKEHMGVLKICAFDGTDPFSKPISNCVNANIGKLANSFDSDRFEAAVLNVKTDKNNVEDNDILVCFDPLSEQRSSWGGCWDIQNAPDGKLYTEYDMTGLK